MTIDLAVLAFAYVVLACCSVVAIVCAYIGVRSLLDDYFGATAEVVQIAEHRDWGDDGPQRSPYCFCGSCTKYYDNA